MRTRERGNQDTQKKLKRNARLLKKKEGNKQHTTVNRTSRFVRGNRRNKRIRRELSTDKSATWPIIHQFTGMIFLILFVFQFVKNLVK